MCLETLTAAGVRYGRTANITYSESSQAYTHVAYIGRAILSLHNVYGMILYTFLRFILLKTANTRADSHTYLTHYMLVCVCVCVLPKSHHTSSISWHKLQPPHTNTHKPPPPDQKHHHRNRKQRTHNATAHLRFLVASGAAHTLASHTHTHHALTHAHIATPGVCVHSNILCTCGAAHVNGQGRGVLLGRSRRTANGRWTAKFGARTLYVVRQRGSSSGGAANGT